MSQILHDLEAKLADDYRKGIDRKMSGYYDRQHENGSKRAATRECKQASAHKRQIGKKAD